MNNIPINIDTNFKTYLFVLPRKKNRNEHYLLKISEYLDSNCTVISMVCSFEVVDNGTQLQLGKKNVVTYSALTFMRCFMFLCDQLWRPRVADTPFHIQGDGMWGSVIAEALN